MTILQSSFRYVDWASLMRRLFGSRVDSSQLLLVHFPSFLRELDRLVSIFGVRCEDCDMMEMALAVFLTFLVQGRSAELNCSVCWRGVGGAGGGGQWL